MEPFDDALHVYPTSLELADLQHEEPGTRVRASLAECVLCQTGTCVQLLVRADVVVHALGPTRQ